MGGSGCAMWRRRIWLRGLGLACQGGMFFEGKRYVRSVMGGRYVFGEGVAGKGVLVLWVVQFT